jgi:hypothetical protein
MGGQAAISYEHLGWLRGQWKPADSWQSWTLACLSGWARYYLYDGWKAMAAPPAARF